MNCYESKTRIIKELLIYSLMAGILYFITILLSYSTYPSVVRYRLIGWYGTLFCCFLIFLSILKLFKFGPVVVVSEEGIIDHRLNFGLISWTNIQSLKRTDIDESQSIEIKIQCSRNLLKKRNILNLDFLDDASKINIVFHYLSPGVDRVWEYIKKKHPEKIVTEY